MPPRKKKNKVNILPTTDTFIAAVPWGANRAVLVFHRVHGGRKYVRLRTWNCHQVSGIWYPTDRFFVIPIEHASSLASAIDAAARCEPVELKPQWYKDREQADQERYDLFVELDAPELCLDSMRRKVKKGH